MKRMHVPRGLVYAGLILLILAMIPPAIIARTRAVTSELPRIHFQQDMALQHRYNAQQVNPMFLDGRAMRPKVPNTIARGDVYGDDHFVHGIVDDDWADEFPPQVEVDMAFLERGRERYEIFCHMCHGVDGYGDGMVHRRAEQRMSMLDPMGTSWVPPTSLHERTVRDQPLGEIYNTITHGRATMAPYGDKISIEDRWAIVAYVKALQRSQDAQVEDAADGGD